ncbi:MAG: SDR family oxidoreductase [SAR202 cluster bacterium]|nr:SDR family oxidoreductase [SAR202 cluster bacterium]
MQRLLGQIAIVTGGARGIGGATARRLAEEGAKVLVADIDIDEARANVEAIRRKGCTAEAFKADVGSHADVQAMVEKAVSVWGRLDILVNNAYNPTTGGRGTIEEVSEEMWDSGMAVLVKSIFLASKYAVPHMRKAGGGSIINISSAHGLLQAPGFAVYETGKIAVIGLTKQMAMDFGPDNIRVNAVCPGHIVTERLKEFWVGKESGLKFFEDQYPLRRVGRPEEIADPIVFLCSKEASFITGVALPIDGGLTVQLQENFGVRQAHYLEGSVGTKMPY